MKISKAELNEIKDLQNFLKYVVEDVTVMDETEEKEAIEQEEGKREAVSYDEMVDELSIKMNLTLQHFYEQDKESEDKEESEEEEQVTFEQFLEEFVLELTEEDEELSKDELEAIEEHEEGNSEAITFEELLKEMGIELGEDGTIITSENIELDGTTTLEENEEESSDKGMEIDETFTIGNHIFTVTEDGTLVKNEELEEETTNEDAPEDCDEDVQDPDAEEEKEMVNHPDHYNQSFIETLEKFLLLFQDNPDIIKGGLLINIIRYSDRAGFKDNKEQDNEKGKFFLDVYNLLFPNDFENVELYREWKNAKKR